MFHDCWTVILHITKISIKYKTCVELTSQNEDLHLVISKPIDHVAQIFQFKNFLTFSFQDHYLVYPTRQTALSAPLPTTFLHFPTSLDPNCSLSSFTTTFHFSSCFPKLEREATLLRRKSSTVIYPLLSNPF